MLGGKAIHHPAARARSLALCLGYPGRKHLPAQTRAEHRANQPVLMLRRSCWEAYEESMTGLGGQSAEFGFWDQSPFLLIILRAREDLSPDRG